MLEDLIDDILVFNERHHPHGGFAVGADERVHLVYAFDHGRPFATDGKRQTGLLSRRLGSLAGRRLPPPSPGPAGVPPVIYDCLLVDIRNVEDDLGDEVQGVESACIAPVAGVDAAGLVYDGTILGGVPKVGGN